MRLRGSPKLLTKEARDRRIRYKRFDGGRD